MYRFPFFCFHYISSSLEMVMSDDVEAHDMYCRMANTRILFMLSEDTNNFPHSRKRLKSTQSEPKQNYVTVYVYINNVPGRGLCYGMIALNDLERREINRV